MHVLFQVRRLPSRPPRYIIRALHSSENVKGALYAWELQSVPEETTEAPLSTIIRSYKTRKARDDTTEVLVEMRGFKYLFWITDRLANTPPIITFD
jgi:hypothetical protein